MKETAKNRKHKTSSLARSENVQQKRMAVCLPYLGFNIGKDINLSHLVLICARRSHELI